MAEQLTSSENTKTDRILSTHTNKRQNNCLEKASVNYRVDFIVIACLASEVTEQVNWTCKEVATYTTETVAAKLVAMTMDKLQVPLISSAQLVHVV